MGTMLQFMQSKAAATATWQPMTIPIGDGKTYYYSSQNRNLLIDTHGNYYYQDPSSGKPVPINQDTAQNLLSSGTTRISLSPGLQVVGDDGEGHLLYSTAGPGSIVLDDSGNPIDPYTLPPNATLPPEYFNGPTAEAAFKSGAGSVSYVNNSGDGFTYDRLSSGGGATINSGGYVDATNGAIINSGGYSDGTNGAIINSGGYSDGTGGGGNATGSSPLGGNLLGTMGMGLAIMGALSSKNPVQGLMGVAQSMMMNQAMGGGSMKQLLSGPLGKVMGGVGFLMSAYSAFQLLQNWKFDAQHIIGLAMAGVGMAAGLMAMFPGMLMMTAGLWALGAIVVLAILAQFIKGTPVDRGLSADGQTVQNSIINNIPGAVTVNGSTSAVTPGAVATRSLAGTAGAAAAGAVMALTAAFNPTGSAVKMSDVQAPITTNVMQQSPVNVTMQNVSGPGNTTKEAMAFALPSPIASRQTKVQIVSSPVVTGANLGYSYFYHYAQTKDGTKLVANEPALRNAAAYYVSAKALSETTNPDSGLITQVNGIGPHSPTVY